MGVNSEGLKVVNVELVNSMIITYT